DLHNIPRRARRRAAVPSPALTRQGVRGMANETTITMVGNLTADPELRFLPRGDAMVKFTVASTPRILDRESGQWKDGDPLFLACTAFRHRRAHRRVAEQ